MALLEKKDKNRDKHWKLWKKSHHNKYSGRFVQVQHSNITREIYSRTDMQTHAGRLGLGFDLLTSGSVHADVLTCAICLPTLVLLAQAVFLSEHRKTDRQTNRCNWTCYPTLAAIQLAWVITVCDDDDDDDDDDAFLVSNSSMTIQ